MTINTTLTSRCGQHHRPANALWLKFPLLAPNKSRNTAQREDYPKEFLEISYKFTGIFLGMCHSHGVKKAPCGCCISSETECGKQGCRTCLLYCQLDPVLLYLEQPHSVYHTV